MKHLCWLIAVAALALVASLGSGCGKKADPKTSGETASQEQPPAAGAKAAPATSVKLSGSQEVMAAIDRKDYDGAIAQMLSIRQGVRTPEQQLQFANLA